MTKISSQPPPPPSSSLPSGRYPKVIAFDLDYTLWDLWIDTHITPPLKRPGKAINQLRDRHGSVLEFYQDVPEILREINEMGITVVAASRTGAVDLAREALDLLLLTSKDGEGTVKAVSMFKQLEIYPGSKLAHFRKIHAKTKVAYEDMLFFDDERRNKEVESLGITMHLITNGVTRSAFSKGLDAWRKRTAHLAAEA